MRHTISNISSRGYLRVFVLAIFFSQPMLAKETFRSTAQQVHLIELFSTQSCSSCPPAQAWVSNLKGAPGLWKTFIPVVFHVDYWDYLGWKDPYSDPIYTRRQKQYVSEWTGRSGYTPMFVVDGSEARVRSVNEFNQLGAKVGVLEVTRENKNKFTIQFMSEAQLGKPVYANFAVLGSGISTKVTAGENDGLKLRHDFLSLKSGKVLLKESNRRYKGSVEIPISKTKPAPEKSIVVWISQGRSLNPIQAIGGSLKE